MKESRESTLEDAIKNVCKLVLLISLSCNLVEIYGHVSIMIINDKITELQKGNFVLACT